MVVKVFNASSIILALQGTSSAVASALGHLDTARALLAEAAQLRASGNEQAAQLRLQLAAQQVAVAEQDIQTILVAQQSAGSYLSDPAVSQAYYDSITQTSQITTQANALKTAIQQLQLSAPPASAGEIVEQEARATVDDAASQHPLPNNQVLAPDGRITTPPDTTSPTNAIPSPPEFPPPVDYGTDDELKKAEQLQSPNFNPNPLPGPGRQEPVVNITPGAAAGSDDSGKTPNATQSEIDAAFSEQYIFPKPNVLDQYASYTYTASVYLLNKNDFQTIVNTKQKTIPGKQLLFQSAGAPVGGRNPFFSNDYYIEDIQLKSVIAGKGSGWSHNVMDLKMTVVEPNGITFLQNLEQAVQQYLGSTNATTNYQAQNYLLVLRFYGYDQNGDLVVGGVPKPDGSSDPNAFVEKFYPFQINNIKFKVASKLVQYEITGTPAQYNMNSGSIRGSIPYNVELSGKTVKDVLTGPSVIVGVNSTVPQVVDDTYDPDLNTNSSNGTAQVLNTPPKASTAPDKNTTVRQGLMTALNEYQAALVRDGIYTYPDKYTIEFANASIEQAKIKRAGTTDKKRTPNGAPTTAAQAADPNKQSADLNSKIQTITAGQQIVSVIDQIVRNSTFIEDQQLATIDPTTGQQRINNTGAKNVAWYKINFQAVPMQWDPKRNDYAYEMKYTVSVYRINSATPPWFPAATFKGVHKSYPYWFTGQNTSVLNYEQTYNSQYHLVLSGGVSRALQEGTANLNELQKFAYSTRSNESSQQAKGRTNEPAANLADYLYNPADLGKATVTIVGDPAWLQQGEAFAGQFRNSFNFNAFLPDGTINFDAQEVLFEVLFNKPVDYDTNTGLMDPGQNNYGADRAVGLAGRATQSYIYQATTVMSNFSKGKFTQQLDGVLRNYKPQDSAKLNQLVASELQVQSLLSQSISRIPTLSANQSQLLAVAVNGAQAYINSTTAAGGYSSVSQGVQNNNAIAGALNKALSTISTMIAKPAGAPTTNNLPIGIPGVNTTGATPSLATPPFVAPGSTTTTSNSPTVNDPQILAAGDDAGYDSKTDEQMMEGFEIGNQGPTISEEEIADYNSSLGDFLG